MLTTAGLTHLTQDEPGIGGVLKHHPEDFIVEELAREPFTGTGDFLYLYVEKTLRLTTDVVRLFARHFGVSWDAIGYAGLKDKHAVTRQWFSIHRAAEDRAAAFHDDHIRILTVDRHDRPLYRGQLAANRFQIKVREVEPVSALRARRILDRLVAQGAPNFIGEQRFGYRDTNHLQGRCLIQGDLQHFLNLLLGSPHESEAPLNQQARAAYDAGDYKRALELWPTVHRFERQALGPLSRGAPPADAVNNIDEPHRTLLVSAYQSAVFNQLLNDRIRAGLLGELLPGDIAIRHDTHGIFEVRHLDREQPRAQRLEISPTGPMWGRTMLRATGQPGEWERTALHESGLTEADLAQPGPFIPEGSRRSYRLIIHDPQIAAGSDARGPYVYVGFSLPRGSFATIVMREIMKAPTHHHHEHEHDHHD